MRKIYVYAKDGHSPVQEFIDNINDKIMEKLIFQIIYIRNESNPFCEPYVKHFSMERYRKMYELRLKAAETMVRIIFYEHNGEIVFLHAFHKRDKKDTDKGLETAFKILESIVDNNGKIPKENKEGLRLYDKRINVARKNKVQ